MVSPFEKLFQQSPDYNFLHTLGCECFPLLRPYNSHKLRPRSNSYVFLRYSSVHKGYKCFHIQSQKLYISRNVTFNETYFPFAHITSTANTEQVQTVPRILEIIPPNQYSAPISPDPTYTASSESTNSSSSAHASPINNMTIIPLGSNVRQPIVTRSCTNSLKPKRFLDYQFYNMTNYPLATDSSESEPTCYTQASKMSQWRSPMAAELDALASNKTWVLWILLALLISLDANGFTESRKKQMVL